MNLTQLKTNEILSYHCGSLANIIAVRYVTDLFYLKEPACILNMTFIELNTKKTLK